MKKKIIKGLNYYGFSNRIREACRGFIIKDDKILLTYMKNTDTYMIPGGGLEEETYEECCIRELKEETGYIVEPLNKFLRIDELYENYQFISYYYECIPVGNSEKRLTKAEQKSGLVIRWLSINDALDVFSKYQEYAATNEEKRGIYYREYCALKAYISFKKK